MNLKKIFRAIRGLWLSTNQNYLVASNDLQLKFLHDLEGNFDFIGDAGTIRNMAKISKKH